MITRLDVHGGAELSTLIEIEELAARGHRVGVVTVAEPATPAAVERLDAAGIGHHHLVGPVVRQAAELRQMVRRHPPDVVHAVIWAAELVVALGTFGLRVPTIVSLVNMQYDPAAVAQAPSPRRLEALRRIEGVALRHGIDRFHCLTEAGARHSVEQLGIDPTRISVIPRGRRRQDLTVDDGELASCRDELLAGGDVLLLNVGRHELQKGQDLLIDAVGGLTRRELTFALAIAGREGNVTPLLRDRIRSAGLDATVHLLGARRDVATLLAAADIVCVTSRWEGLGGAVIEALGAGAPIVAFGVPAVAEVVGDAGVVVAPFDTVAFAAEIRSLGTDAARRRELSERARRRFDTHFEISAVVDRIEDLYRGVSDAT